MLTDQLAQTLTETKSEAAWRVRRLDVLCGTGYARRGESRVGHMRNRERQRERREPLKWWLARPEIEWRKEDVLERLDADLLIAMSRVLGLDEETREARSAAKSSLANHRSRATLYAGELDISSPTQSPMGTPGSTGKFEKAKREIEEVLFAWDRSQAFRSYISRP
jgi:hypothetical protein